MREHNSQVHIILVHVLFYNSLVIYIGFLIDHNNYPEYILFSENKGKRGFGVFGVN